MNGSKTHHAAGSAGERGSALVLAVFILVLVSMMGLGLLFLAQAEVSMSQASLRSTQSFFRAEAGLEDARTTLFQINGKGFFDDDLTTAAGVDGRIDFDPNALEAVYDSQGVFQGFTGYGDDVPLRGLTAFADGNYIAFLTNDAIDVQTLGPATASSTDTNDRVVLTGAAVGPNRSIEIVQAIIEPRSPVFPMPPATLTLLGPTPDFASGTSSSSSYNGNDCPGGGGGNVATVGAVGSDAEASVESGIYKDKDKDKTNGPEFVSGSYTDADTVVDLTDTGDPLVSESVDSQWTDCQALKDMIEELRRTATSVCTGNSCTLPAGTTMDSVTFIDNGGDPSYTFRIGPGDPDGLGTLVVTGKLELGGARTWDGILLVVGRGEVERKGAGNGYISGAAIVADIAGPDDRYGTDDDCTGGPAGDGFGIASYQVDGGGNGNIGYCTGDIRPAMPLESYTITEFHQR